MKSATKPNTRLEDRIDAVSSVISDWMAFWWLAGLGVFLLVVIDGKPDQALVVMLVKYGLLAVLAVPLLILGAVKAFLRLRRAWQTGG